MRLGSRFAARPSLVVTGDLRVAVSSSLGRSAALLHASLVVMPELRLRHSSSLACRAKPALA